MRSVAASDGKSSPSSRYGCQPAGTSWKFPHQTIAPKGVRPKRASHPAVAAARPPRAGSPMAGIDAKILDILQANASVPLTEIAARVGLSSTPCWRRIKKMEEEGLIARRVA